MGKKKKRKHVTEVAQPPYIIMISEGLYSGQCGYCPFETYGLNADYDIPRTMVEQHLIVQHHIQITRNRNSLWPQTKPLDFRWSQLRKKETPTPVHDPNLTLSLSPRERPTS